jgi:hypothetical protein
MKNSTPSAPSQDVTVPNFEGVVVTCEYDMRDLVALNDEDYVSPIGSTFPAVDAFMVTKTPFFDPVNSNLDEFLIGPQMASSKKREHSLKGSQVMTWISKVKDVRSTVAKVVIIFVVNTEDLDQWHFKTKDKGKVKNYQILPGELAQVQ